MRFAPLGYSFVVRAPVSSDSARRRLRDGMASWFASGEKPRGWLVGPLLCLWLRSNDRFGPLLIAVIADDGMAVRIRGRAGSDLNGTLWALLLLPGLVWSLAMAWRTNQLDPRTMAFGAGGLLLLLWSFWSASRQRHEADPLVAFVEERLRTV